MSYRYKSCLHEKSFNRGLALVVVDDHFLRDSVYTLLEGDGYDVLAARSCVDGLGIFQRSVRHIDLLVTACGTPGISTVELADECTRRNMGVGVLFISNSPERELSGALAPGRRAFLSRSFRGEELLRAVRELLAPAPALTLPPCAPSMSPARLAG